MLPLKKNKCQDGKRQDFYFPVLRVTVCWRWEVGESCTFRIRQPGWYREALFPLRISPLAIKGLFISLSLILRCSL